MDRALIDCTAKNRSFLNFSILKVVEKLKYYDSNMDSQNWKEIGSDGWNYVQSLMFDRSKLWIRCSSSITSRWTRPSSFVYWKNDVRVGSMCNLVNQVKAWCSLGCLSSIANRWTCSNLFHVQKNMFEFVVWCSIEWYSTHHLKLDMAILWIFKLNFFFYIFMLPPSW